MYRQQVSRVAITLHGFGISILMGSWASLSAGVNPVVVCCMVSAAVLLVVAGLLHMAAVRRDEDRRALQCQSEELESLRKKTVVRIKEANEAEKEAEKAGKRAESEEEVVRSARRNQAFLQARAAAGDFLRAVPDYNGSHVTDGVLTVMLVVENRAPWPVLCGSLSFSGVYSGGRELFPKVGVAHSHGYEDHELAVGGKVVLQLRSPLEVVGPVAAVALDGVGFGPANLGSFFIHAPVHSGESGPLHA